jgi:hypothetical protein
MKTAAPPFLTKELQIAIRYNPDKKALPMPRISRMIHSCKTRKAPASTARALLLLLCDNTQEEVISSAQLRTAC